MSLERFPAESSLIDVFDRVLDKGIVVDAWVRVSLVGVDLITVEAQIIVASIETYFKHANAFGLGGWRSASLSRYATKPLDFDTLWERRNPENE